MTLKKIYLLPLQMHIDITDLIKIRCKYFWGIKAISLYE